MFTLALALVACASRVNTLTSTPALGPTPHIINVDTPAQPSATLLPQAGTSTLPPGPLSSSPIPPFRSPPPTLLPPQIPSRISPDNATSLEPIARIQFSPWEVVLAISWSPDGGTLAISAGEKIHLVEAGTFKERLVLEPGVWMPALAISPEGPLLASGGRDGTVHLWDWMTGEMLQSIRAHKKGTNTVAFSLDGKLLASAGNDGMVRLWDAKTGELQTEMIGGSYGIPGVAFTPDGASLAIANGDVIRIRQLQTGRFVQTLRGNASFYCLAFTAGGQVLATGDSDNGVLLWDYPSGEIRFRLAAHAGERSRPAALIWRVAFSPDGRLLASAGGDQTVRLWEVAIGKLIVTLTRHSAAVTSLAFSPDGRWLATGGLDGTVLIWQSQP